jgi:OmpA-OmpF porin, OOP family
MRRQWQVSSRTSVAVVVTALCSSVSARAQTKGFALDRFEPSERGGSWFSADSMDFREGRVSVGVTGDSAYEPLVVRDEHDHERAVLVGRQVFGHLGASWVPYDDSLRLSLDAPLLVSQKSGDFIIDDSRFAARDGFALGDLRLSGDAAFLGEWKTSAQVALGLAVYLPSGSRDSFAGDGSWRIAPRALVAGEASVFTYGARVGFLWRANRDDFAGVPLGSELQFVGAAGLRILDRRLVVGPELLASTVVSDRGDGLFRRESTPLEMLFGAHFDLFTEVRIGAGVGRGLGVGLGAPALRALASVQWIGPPKYASPWDAARAHTPVDATRAKPAEVARPNVPGAPSPVGAGAADRRPLVPVDMDGDGVWNDSDVCPEQAGSPNDDPEKNGCPEPAPEPEVTAIVTRVEFHNGEAMPPAESESVLQDLADALIRHPELTRVSVEGHTDNRGNEALNRQLSARRAAAVVAWLIAHGVDADRLVAVGFGSDRPLVPNDTQAGRQTNRRVEFRIVESSGTKP